MLPIFPLAKNVLSICRQNSPSIESNNNHYTKNILAILARKCAEIRWLQKIAVIWLQIFEGSYFAKTSPRFQNSGELFCHFQDLIFFSGELFCHPGELFCGGLFCHPGELFCCTDLDGPNGMRPKRGCAASEVLSAGMPLRSLKYVSLV